MIRIGITGSIGAGKSFIAQKIKQRGIPIYDTDREAKRLMMLSEEIRSKLIKLLGNEAYSSSGEFNKRLIASYLFASEDNARRINAIVHPAVKTDFLRWTASQESQTIGMECAILFESGFDKLTNAVIVVSAPTALCISRAMLRDGCSKEEVMRRMALQMPDNERCAKTPYVIMNDGKTRIDECISEILARICHASF